MTFTREQRQNAYKQLPEEVQSFIMSNETTRMISEYLKEANLSEEQITRADSEILYAMSGLQTLEEAIKNISELNNKSLEELSSLKSKLEDNIFSKYPELGKVSIIPEKDAIIITQSTKVEAMKKLDEVPMNDAAPENVATAAAHENLPMVEKGEVAHDVPHVESKPVEPHKATPATSAPTPLATPAPIPQATQVESKKTDTKPPQSFKDARYPGGKDPYREPLV